MARHRQWSGQPNGWYVCDAGTLDRYNRALPLHDDPLSEGEARELAVQMTEE